MRMPWWALRDALGTVRDGAAVARAEAQTFVRGPFYTSRALDRKARGYGHGHGAMASSIKTRRSR